LFSNEKEICHSVKCGVDVHLLCVHGRAILTSVHSSSKQFNCFFRLTFHIGFHRPRTFDPCVVVVVK